MTDINAPSPVSDQIQRRNVMVLVAAQAILGAQLPMNFIMGGLAGHVLSPNPCWATLPITMIVLGNMLSANPLSALMTRHGRRAGFTLGALMGGRWGGDFGIRADAKLFRAVPDRLAVHRQLYVR